MAGMGKAVIFLALFYGIKSARHASRPKKRLRDWGWLLAKDESGDAVQVADWKIGYADGSHYYHIIPREEYDVQGRHVGGFTSSKAALDSLIKYAEERGFAVGQAYK